MTSRFKAYAASGRAQNIISFSGGKDSTAIYLLALKWGIPFRAIFAEGTAPYPAGYDPEVSGYYGINKIVEWSKTTRGGRQFDLLKMDEPSMCSSKYGLCE